VANVEQQLCEWCLNAKRRPKGAQAPLPELVLDELIDALLAALLEVREPQELILAILARGRCRDLALLVNVTPAHIRLGGAR
jgi:hypothetical protein